MVIDIEGSDSRERWEQGKKFQNKVALFGLVLSNVLLINIWYNDVGRMSASNYEIIRLILGLNVQYFDQKQVKRIVFVLRDSIDVDERNGNRHIEDLLVQDVKRIWNEIKKPPHIKSEDIDSYFSFKVFLVNSLTHRKEKFEQDVAKLKGVIMGMDCLDFGNVPLSDFYLYMRSSWEIIDQNKDINIPGQVKMVSEFRCEEIKKEEIARL